MRIAARTSHRDPYSCTYTIKTFKRSPSETDFNSSKSHNFREVRDDGRSKTDDDDELMISSSSPFAANETTQEFVPYNRSSTSEVGKFCIPHSEIGFFNPPINV
ncbi:hypothetical protein QVD17_39030 [Tagetes erecta]|uniref:Uncharacterized protein n=1 Tax=Tagetes erecta TaxID=13708 RepID=A0AAD8JPZ0_TARER|nr:hypothetical protein QVD17_39030 [Tagetes erecta]